MFSKTVLTVQKPEKPATQTSQKVSIQEPRSSEEAPEEERYGLASKTPVYTGKIKSDINERLRHELTSPTEGRTEGRKQGVRSKLQNVLTYGRPFSSLLSEV